MLKRTLLAALIVSALGRVSNFASADVVIRTAPPPPRAERVPEARRGYIWTPGHWEWRRQQHFWVNGSWMRERPGYTYQPHTWVERDGRWAMQGGRWDRGVRRDNDRDGYRDYNRGGRRDNDGDGVPNNRDARPNNPNLR